MNIHFHHILVTIIYIGYTTLSPAQVCGLLPADRAILSNALEHITAQPSSDRIESRDQQKIINITFHILSRTTARKQVPERKILDQVCQLNEDFAAIGMKFSLKSIDYIQRDDVEQQLDEILEQYFDKEAVNIFAVDRIPNDRSPNEAQVLGYFDVFRDLIVVQQNQISDQSIVLSHELGHFFGLLHTYNGWEAEPYADFLHGNPVSTTAPDGSETELMDGSNCETAGDFICDTPPDYFFSFRTDNCHFKQTVLDPNQQLVNPEEHNFMGSFTVGCNRADYHFSGEQQDLIKQNLFTRKRNYIQSNSVAFNQTEPTIPTLEYPTPDQSLENYNLIPLTWQAVEGAQKYLIEIDRVPTFNVFLSSKIVHHNFAEITALEANATYYWRVKTFNDAATCQPFSETRTFRTGNEAVDLFDPYITALSVAPNPIGVGQEFTVDISTERTFVADIQLFDLRGRKVRQLHTNFSPYKTQRTVPTDDLPSGWYQLTVIANATALSRRILIIKE